LSEAARWYEQYNALAPDDLLGLKRLSETCTALEQAGAEDENRIVIDQILTEEQESLALCADDRCVVAELLDVPVNAVTLGPELIENGGFEEWSNNQPVWWRWSDMATGDIWNKGVFVAGQDVFSWTGGGKSARIDGLWVRRDANLPGSRAGYASSGVALLPDTLYLIAFSYRTDRLKEGGSGLWIASDPDVLFQYEHYLPLTQGSWRRYYILGRNLPDREIRTLYLRSWATGSFLLDDISLRTVLASSLLTDSLQSTIFSLK